MDEWEGVTQVNKQIWSKIPEKLQRWVSLFLQFRLDASYRGHIELMDWWIMETYDWCRGWMESWHCLFTWIPYAKLQTLGLGMWTVEGLRRWMPVLETNEEWMTFWTFHSKKLGTKSTLSAVHCWLKALQSVGDGVGIHTHKGSNQIYCLVKALCRRVCEERRMKWQLHT